MVRSLTRPSERILFEDCSTLDSMSESMEEQSNIRLYRIRIIFGSR